MIWHILIITSLIVNAWAVYGIWNLTKTLDIMLDMFDITKHGLEVVRDRLKEMKE